MLARKISRRKKTIIEIFFEKCNDENSFNSSFKTRKISFLSTNLFATVT